MVDRGWIRSEKDFVALQPQEHYVSQLMPTYANLFNPCSALPTKFVHNSINKQKCPVNRVAVKKEGLE